MAPQTIVEKFWERAAGEPGRAALRFNQDGEWSPISWADYGASVQLLARALRALGLGPGRTMALLSGNRPEWHIADLACMSMGAITVPVYATSSPDQVAYILGHSECSIAVVENAHQLAKILEVRSRLPALTKVIVMDAPGERAAGDDLVLSWDESRAVADAYDGNMPGAPAPDDDATFVYTSGTTGRPKGVRLTHRNLWWTCGCTEKHFEGRMEGGRTVSYLPLSHIAERMLSHFLQIYYGTETWFARSIDTLVEDMKACRPTYFFGVPRVWEKLHAGIEARLEEAGPKNRKAQLARRGILLGHEVAEAEQRAVADGGRLADARVPLRVRLEHSLLDRLVLAKIRAALGLDRCVLPLSAAAPMDPDLVWYWHSLGLKVAEGYGQTEDTGPTTWNLPAAVLIGSVGVPLEGVEVRIAEDGEILVRGGNVTPGYLKDEAATKQLLDVDGWMHSGDIGEFDRLGRLQVTGRKKDLIITAGGKNIAPQEIEGRLQRHSLISHVVIIGDRRPFLSALVTLDEGAVREWCKEHGVGGDAGEVAFNERALEEIEAGLNEVNRHLARAEQIKKARVLDRDFSEARGEITPTLKVRRREIASAYAEVIEEMYSDASARVGGARAPEHATSG